MRYSPPPPELREYVSSLYELRQEVATYDETERSDRPQLRILLSGSGEYIFPDGHCDQASRTIILGPTSGSVRGMGIGPMHVVGAGLLPPAWVAMMGKSADTALDRALDAEQLFGDAATRLFHAVQGTQSTDERFRLISAFVAEATSKADPAQIAFTHIVDAWLTSSADPRIEALVEASGLSVRQLERMTRRYYGLPPKTLSRKYRALKAAMLIARGEDIEASEMADSFYDQSHLIRELKRFAGLTPQQIMRRESYLMAEIATGRGALRGQVGPLVSDA
jgi:AraC-like DNA-binding protein